MATKAKQTTKKKDGKAVGREVEKVTEGNRQTVQAKGAKKAPTKKAPARKAPATKSNTILKAGGSPIPKGPKGHRGCVQGARKEQVAKLFDSKGADAAKAKGAELGLKPNTIKSWIGIWVRSDRKAFK